MSLAQSTARTVMLKLFLTSDHVTAATSKTVAITISKNGGAFGNPNAGASNATEVSSGWYKFALDTTDTNTLGDLVIRGTSASCDDTERVLEVVSATTGGATNLDAAVSAVKTKTDFLPSVTAGAAGGVFIAGTNAATTVTTSFTTTFTGNLTGSVGSVTGLTASDVGTIKTKTDFLPSATAGAAGGVFIAGTNAATTVTTSFTTTFTGNLTGNVGGNVTGSVGSVTGLTASDVGTIKTKTDFLPSATAGAAGGVFIAGTNAATTITTALTTTFTGNLTGNVGGNVTGSVGSVTGAVGSVTGLTASNLDTTVSSRLATVGYTAPPTAIQNADALLDRDMSSGVDSGSTTVRTVRQALRFLRNKWDIAAGTLTVTKEDDATASWTAAVTGTASVTASDPAGP